MTAMQQWLDRAASTRAQRGTVRRADLAVDRERTPVDLASNDYLGLAGDARVKAAAVAAIEAYGTGARASRVVTGTTAPHLELEAELCRLTGQSSALVFSSGYLANLGVLTALGRPGALILLDGHVHASIVDAARLSRAGVQTFAHSDLDALRTALAGRSVPRAIVVVESIYSVLGDAADLVGLAALCAEYDALLVVDEAHGVGVIGAGRGGVALAGLAGSEHVIVTATLSKALGSQGGAVLGPPAIREHLVNAARSFIFDTGLAPAAAAAAGEACRIIVAEPDRVAAIARAASVIAGHCGIEPGPGAVQSVAVSDAESAWKIAQDLAEQRILVGCFRPPSVPDGVSRIRITATAALDLSHVTWAAATIHAAVRNGAAR